MAAAEVLASNTTEEDMKRGSVLPRFGSIRTLSAQIAARVAQMAYEEGVATELPKPANLLGLAQASMYNPNYRKAIDSR